MVDRVSKIDIPSIVPGGDLAPDVTEKNFEYYYDQAREICRRVQNKAHLSDDEIIVLAVVATQLALAKHVEPGDRDAEQTLTNILSILDHNDVNAAISSKMDLLLSGKGGSPREDAPSGHEFKVIDACKDPEEPAGS